MIGSFQGFKGASVVEDTGLAGSGGATPAGPAGAEQLWRLACDYDRWGLAPEAEVARLRYRKKLVDSLVERSMRTAPTREPRDPLNPG